MGTPVMARNFDTFLLEPGITPLGSPTERTGAGNASRRDGSSRVTRAATPQTPPPFQENPHALKASMFENGFDLKFLVKHKLDEKLGGFLLFRIKRRIYALTLRLATAFSTRANVNRWIHLKEDVDTLRTKYRNAKIDILDLQTDIELLNDGVPQEDADELRLKIQEQSTTIANQRMI
ncbi:uncharacterized protein Z518_05618 [Rhinocladiella mackenziei CBS 650.93]|uniref:Uncharacterized protein n=1 Tax=Rhinocladiella mackenziei CBS 650.93 TaxID=1442369 RepID=A0A0D2H2T8_9EURO|nr:uncharacterized protein Z518_05618 [Rhinocladiella mackenziei CBS 650.93]KIX04748.1 hypothetical protein Z518_05618 [Rhinocladiella mackenziei CBS 650.93]